MPKANDKSVTISITSACQLDTCWASSSIRRRRPGYNALPWATRRCSKAPYSLSQKLLGYLAHEASHNTAFPLAALTWRKKTSRTPCLKGMAHSLSHTHPPQAMRISQTESVRTRWDNSKGIRIHGHGQLPLSSRVMSAHQKPKASPRRRENKQPNRTGGAFVHMPQPVTRFSCARQPVASRQDGQPALTPPQCGKNAPSTWSNRLCPRG